MEYYPTRPNNPYQDDCRPKPDCGCTPPPTVCPPQKPPVCQPPQPVMGQIPPVPTVIEGSSLYEARLLSGPICVSISGIVLARTVMKL